MTYYADDSYYSYDIETEEYDETENEEYEEQDPYMTYDEEMEAFADAENYMNDEE